MTVHRIGAYAGVWRLYDERRHSWSVALWFDKARAQQKARRIKAKHSQTSLDL